MRDKPELTWETMRRMQDMSWFDWAQIFDDLLIVAQRETNCFVWKTSEGLAVFDGIWPDAAAYLAIRSAITEAGWDPDAIRKFFITHGHPDHTGCGKWLKERHNAETFLSQRDERYWREQEETGPDFPIDRYVSDGDTIDCGGKSVTVVSTPGHTPGCVSYLFPVHDRGKRHLAALFGGATPPWGDAEGTQLHLRSLERFVSAAGKLGADVPLTNHTAFDNGLIRMAYSKARYPYLPNIYITGQEGFSRFCEVFRAVCE